VIGAPGAGCSKAKLLPAGLASYVEALLLLMRGTYLEGSASARKRARAGRQQAQWPSGAREPQERAGALIRADAGCSLMHFRRIRPIAAQTEPASHNGAIDLTRCSYVNTDDTRRATKPVPVIRWSAV